MNRGIKLTLLLAVFAMIFVACGNDKEAEKKIAELESRLAEVETSKADPHEGHDDHAVATPEEKPEGPLPIMEFAEEEFDFGTINEGDVKEHTFKFTNVGEAPLIIQDAKGSCGCTVPTYSKEPIPVGGTGEITAKFDSKGQKNLQNKTVTVTANTWPKQTRLKIKAQVTPKATAEPAIQAPSEGPVKK